MTARRTAESPWGTAPPAWPTGETTRFIEVNGYPLAYVEAGTRLPALLLVHGSINDARAFQSQVTPLSPYARTIAVSLRHAWPERWDGAGRGFNVEQHAADIAAFVETQSLGPVHLVVGSPGTELEFAL